MNDETEAKHRDWVEVHGGSTQGAYFLVTPSPPPHVGIWLDLVDGGDACRYWFERAAAMQLVNQFAGSLAGDREPDRLGTAMKQLMTELKARR